MVSKLAVLAHGRGAVAGKGHSLGIEVINCALSDFFLFTFFNSDIVSPHADGFRVFLY